MILAVSSLVVFNGSFDCFFDVLAAPSAILDHLRAKVAPSGAISGHLEAKVSPSEAVLSHLEAQVAPSGAIEGPKWF